MNQTAPCFYRCPKCHRVQRRDFQVRDDGSGRRFYLWTDGRWHASIEPDGCEDCNTFLLRVGEVQGHFDPNVACTSSCQHATGLQCVCSCGGLGHGRAWTRRAVTRR